MTFVVRIVILLVFIFIEIKLKVMSLYFPRNAGPVGTFGVPQTRNLFFNDRNYISQIDGLNVASVVASFHGFAEKIPVLFRLMKDKKSQWAFVLRPQGGVTVFLYPDIVRGYRRIFENLGNFNELCNLVLPWAHYTSEYDAFSKQHLSNVFNWALGFVNQYVRNPDARLSEPCRGAFRELMYGIIHVFKKYESLNLARALPRSHEFTGVRAPVKGKTLWNRLQRDRRRNDSRRGFGGALIQDLDANALSELNLYPSIVERISSFL